MTKHKLFARALALVLCLTLVCGLTGCVFSTPESVGRIGEVDITSGNYLLAQYDAYQQAADLAQEDQDPTKVSAFLRQQITPEGGEPVTVADFVAEKTQQNLDRYAAIETRFAQLGGELTELEQTQAEAYAQQLMDQYGPVYEANGIGLATLEQFEKLLLKEQVLLDLVYGPEGEAPISDDELGGYLAQEMVQLAYVVIPLYNSQNFAPASDDEKTEMKKKAQAIVDQYTAQTAALTQAQASPSITEAEMKQIPRQQLEAFRAAAAAGLGEVYQVLGSPAPEGDPVSTALLGHASVDATFTEGDSAKQLYDLAFGQAAVLEHSGFAMMIALRLNPLTYQGMDAVRPQALTDYKAPELRQELADYGAALPHDLDSSAMKKLPAKKIVTG